MSSQLPGVRLPYRVATGSWQMAADLALLEWVSRDPSRLVFRTYGWDRPTLSLGRGERFPGSWDERALAREGIAVVRRPTGGSAVLHVEEVTFAVAASIPGPWGHTPRDFANATADALSRALRANGVPGSRVRTARETVGAGSVCFAGSARGEVEASGYKVAGLASRFGRGGALCHGSVPLTARSRSIAVLRLSGPSEASALERHARSVGELLGSSPEGSADLVTLGEAVAERLAEEIAAGFGARFTVAGFEALGIEPEFEGSLA